MTSVYVPRAAAFAEYHSRNNIKRYRFFQLRPCLTWMVSFGAAVFAFHKTNRFSTTEVGA